MEQINGDLRKLCAELEGRVSARLDGEYEEYQRLLQRRDELRHPAGVAGMRLGVQLAVKGTLLKDVGKLRAAQDEYIKNSEELHEVEVELARLRMLVYNARLVELNLLRRDIVRLSTKPADEWAKLSGAKGELEREQFRGPIEVDVHNLAELEALQLSPHIKQTETLEALQKVIRFYQVAKLDHIIVRIHDVRPGKPGIVWRFPKEEPGAQCKTSS